MTDAPAPPGTLPWDGAPEVVVPLGLDLGLYRGPEGARTVPRLRVKQRSRDLTPPAYEAWCAARAVSESGQLPSLDQLAARLPGADPASVAALVAATPELVLVSQRQDGVLALWMDTTLRPLMVNVGPAAADGTLPVGIADERLELITPQVFEVLLRCARAGSTAQALVDAAAAHAAAGMTEPVWTEPMGLLWAMWSELPFLLAHGVAWLDAADRPYRPGPDQTERPA